jgi:phenylalanyl-tRNA synthetase beta chain
MKIIESILKNFIKIPQNILELTNQKIIEVDEFKRLNESTNLVIGKVLTCIDHPDSDHLHVTTVDVKDEVLQIVCGAANVAKDQYVVVAKVGAILPNNFEIKPRKSRGIDSNGMICSLNELGFDEKLIPNEFKDGIYYFNQEKEIGSDALPHLYQDGFVMTLGLTPNRGDLLSHLGFAYDLASMTNQKIELKPIQIKEVTKENKVVVKINTLGCGRYYARVFEDLEIKESPDWLKSYLLASDIKPINNVVDISNYVLIEYGTPLHTFDFDKVDSNLIVIRDAKDLEEVYTLDNELRVLNSDDVVITNGKEVIAVGGVMGLKNTMIDENTKNVLLEAAYFDPKRIQKTSKKLNLRSDSSLRFERGIDDQRVILGLNRATELLIELANAKVLKGVSKDIHYEVKQNEIRVSKNYFNESLGINLEEKELLSYFKRYNYQYQVLDDAYLIKAPSYRNDLLIDADFLEEISRMYGLDLIPVTNIEKPLVGKLSFKQKRIRALRHKLANLGLNEVITYSLIDPKEVHRFVNIGKKIEVLSPLSEDKKALRQTLITGMLDVVSYNQARQIDDVSIFELGHVFAKDKEDLHLGICLSASWIKNTWNKEALNSSFYLLKGMLDSIFNPLDIYFDYEMKNISNSFHPYIQASIKYQDHVIGHIAEIHPIEAKRLGISKTYTLDINLEPLLVESIDLAFEPLSKYPSITRDLAVIVKEEIKADELLKLIKQTVKKNLIDIVIFDIYQGSHIEKNMKSIAFSLTFNGIDKTLESSDVDSMMKKIISRLSFTYQAIVRN